VSANPTPKPRISLSCNLFSISKQRIQFRCSPVVDNLWLPCWMGLEFSDARSCMLPTRMGHEPINLVDRVRYHQDVMSLRRRKSIATQDTGQSQAELVRLSRFFSSLPTRAPARRSGKDQLRAVAKPQGRTGQSSGKNRFRVAMSRPSGPRPTQCLHFGKRACDSNFRSFRPSAYR
jgi:hypothetical protein